MSLRHVTPIVTLVIAIIVPFALALPTLLKRDVSVSFDGKTFVNKGLVGFGRINASSVDKYGETMGGLGSSIHVESLWAQSDGTFTGLIRMNPDRGHVTKIKSDAVNGSDTKIATDYRARTHTFTFTFNPAKGDSTTENIALTYYDSVLFRLSSSLDYTTGLDPSTVLPPGSSFPALPFSSPQHHLAVDIEGWAASGCEDLAFMSDNYGPYIYTLNRTSGVIVAATAPPSAVLPYIDGQINFTALASPDTGRAPGKGLKGLTFDAQTSTLWACMQTAAVQDYAKGSKTGNQYARLFGFDARDPLKLVLTNEYVVVLPTSSENKTYSQTELHVIDSTTFLLLAENGDGFGDKTIKSKYKQADLISIRGATNIANSKYDSPSCPITQIASDNSTSLNADITPVQYQSFVDLIDDAQLAKFGMQNGGAVDRTLISKHLEGLALVSVPDHATAQPTGDQFLFVVSDNGFMTANGHVAVQCADGSYELQSFSDDYAVEHSDGDTQVFIYRLTIPCFDS